MKIKVLFFALALSCIAKAQDLKTYSGEMQDAILDNGKATYSYYEKDGEMVRHGKFSYTWKDQQAIQVRDKKINVLLSKSISGNFKDGNKDGTWTYSVKYTDYALNHNHGFGVSSDATYSSGSISMTSNYKEGVPHGNWSYSQNYKTRYSIPIGVHTWKWSETSPVRTTILKASFNNGVLSGTFDYNNPFLKESVKFSFDENGLLNGGGTYTNLGSTTELNFENGIKVKEVQRDMSSGEIKIKKDLAAKLQVPNFEYKLDTTDFTQFLDKKMDYFRNDRYFNYRTIAGKKHLIDGDSFRYQEIKGGVYYDVLECTPFDENNGTYNEANRNFERKNYSKALNNYNQLKTFLEDRKCLVCEEDRKKYLTLTDSMIVITESWIEYNEVMDHIKAGDQQLSYGNFDKAISNYNLALEINPKDPFVLNKLKEAENAKTISLKQEEIEILRSNISSLYNTFRKEYIQRTMDVYNNEKIKYPNGKFLYQKADFLITEMQKKLDLIADLDEKINYSNEIIKILEKLNSLNGTDTKTINKELKKAEDSESIRKILGV